MSPDELAKALGAEIETDPDELAASMGGEVDFYDSGQSQFASAVSSGIRGAASVPKGILGGTGAAVSLIPGMQGNALQRAAKGMGEVTEDIVPVNPRYQDTFATKAGGALGQAAGQIGTMMVAAPLRLGAGGLQAVGLTTAGLMGAEQGDLAAEAYGVTDPLKRAGMILGYGAAEAGFESLGGFGSRGFSEALLGRMSDFSGSALKRFAKTAAVEGLEEVPTGQTQDWLTMALAEEDPNNPGFSKTGYQMPPSFFSRENLNKRAEEFALGAVGGSLFGGVSILQNDSSSNQGMRLRHAASQRISELESKPELSQEEQAELSDLKEQDSVIASQLEERGVAPEAQAEILEQARTYDQTFAENLARINQAVDAELSIQDQEIISATEPAIAQAEANPDTQATAQAAAAAQNELLDTSTQDVLEAAQEELSDLKASIPIMVTRDMAQQLLDLGYTRKQVNAMKPEEAQAILSSKTKTTKSNAPQQIQQPEILPEERESGGQIGETLETVSSDSVLGETRSPEEGQVTPTDEQVAASVPELNLADITSLEVISQGTSESDVYRRGNEAIKVAEEYNAPETIGARVRDKLLGDKLLGDGNVRLEGYYRGRKGVLNPVFAEPFIEGRGATQQEIDNLLQQKGFVPHPSKKGRYVIESNGKIYEAQDLDSGNVLVDQQGVPHVIDASVFEVESTPEIQEALRKKIEALKKPKKEKKEKSAAKKQAKPKADEGTISAQDKAALTNLYEQMVREQQSSALYIGEFAERSGIPLEKVQEWILSLNDVTLDEANWPDASQRDRDAKIVFNGRNRLFFRRDGSESPAVQSLTENLKPVPAVSAKPAAKQAAAPLEYVPPPVSTASASTPAQTESKFTSDLKRIGSSLGKTTRPWGGEKVFISDLYKAWAKENPGVSLAQFKSQLFANRAELPLSRLDLVESLNPEERAKVKESAISLVGDEEDFHVVRIPFESRPTVEAPQAAKPKPKPSKKAYKQLQSWADNELQRKLNPTTKKKLEEFKQKLAPMLEAYEPLFKEVVINPYMRSQSGIRLWEDGSLHINPKELFDSLAVVESFQNSKKLFSRMLDEEFKHSVVIDLDASNPKFSKDLQAAWDTLPEDIRTLSAETYFKETGKKYNSDWQAKHEFFRQYWQNEDIRDITENALREKGVIDRLYDLIDSFIEALRKLQQGAVPEVKPILDRLIAEAQKRADEIRQQTGATKDTGSITPGAASMRGKPMARGKIVGAKYKSKAWEDAKAEVLRDLKGAKLTKAKKALQYLEKALDKYQNLFVKGVRLSDPSVGYDAEHIADGTPMWPGEYSSQTDLVIDIPTFLRAFSEKPTSKAIQTQVEEEVIHRGVMSVLSPEDAARLWDNLPEEIHDRVHKSYHFRNILAGHLPETIGSDLSQNQKANYAHEFLRALISDKAFRGRVTESVLSKDLPLAKKVLLYLQRYVERLRQMLAKAPASVQKEIQIYEDLVVRAIRDMQKGIPRLGSSRFNAKTPGAAPVGDVERGLEAGPIYRAGDETESGIKPWSSWTRTRKTAEAYQDNPGFGGAVIRQEVVPEGLNVYELDRPSRKAFGDMAEAIGLDRETGEDWFDSGYQYPWEESSKVRDAFEDSEFDAIEYTDDFPAGAKTIVFTRPVTARGLEAGPIPASTEDRLREISDWFAGTVYDEQEEGMEPQRSRKMDRTYAETGKAAGGYYNPRSQVEQAAKTDELVGLASALYGGYSPQYGQALLSMVRRGTSIARGVSANPFLSMNVIKWLDSHSDLRTLMKVDPQQYAEDYKRLSLLIGSSLQTFANGVYEPLAKMQENADKVTDKALEEAGINDPMAFSNDVLTPLEQDLKDIAEEFNTDTSRASLLEGAVTNLENTRDTTEEEEEAILTFSEWVMSGEEISRGAGTFDDAVMAHVTGNGFNAGAFALSLQQKFENLPDEVAASIAERISARLAGQEMEEEEASEPNYDARAKRIVATSVATDSMPKDQKDVDAFTQLTRERLKGNITSAKYREGIESLGVEAETAFAMDRKIQQDIDRRNLARQTAKQQQQEGRYTREATSQIDRLAKELSDVRSEKTPQRSELVARIKEYSDGKIDALQFREFVSALGVEERPIDQLLTLIDENNRRKKAAAQGEKEVAYDTFAKRLTDRLLKVKKDGETAVPEVQKLTNDYKSGKLTKRQYIDSLMELGVMPQTALNLASAAGKKMREQVQKARQKALDKALKALGPKKTPDLTKRSRFAKLLMESMEAGIFDSQAVREAFAEAFNLHGLTQERLEQLSTLIKKIDLLRDGIPKDKLMGDFNRLMNTIAPSATLTGFLMDAYRGSVLGGIGTILAQFSGLTRLINPFQAAQQTLWRMSDKRIMGNPLNFWRVWSTIAKEGFTAASMARSGVKGLISGETAGIGASPTDLSQVSPVNMRIGLMGARELGQYRSSLKGPFRYLAYPAWWSNRAYNFIRAAEAWTGTIDKNLEFRALATDYFMQKKGMKFQQAWNAVSDLLSEQKNSQMWAEAREIAKKELKEGLITSPQLRERANEIVQDRLDAEWNGVIGNQHREMSAYLNFKQQPVTFLGDLAYGSFTKAASATRKVPIIDFMFLFPRFFVNNFERAFFNSFLSFPFTPFIKTNVDPKYLSERQKRIIRIYGSLEAYKSYRYGVAISGTTNQFMVGMMMALAYGLSQWLGDDDEKLPPPFWVTGQLPPSDFAKQKQMTLPGWWQPNTMYFRVPGTDKFLAFNYVQGNPDLAVNLNMVGAIADKFMFNELLNYKIDPRTKKRVEEGVVEKTMEVVLPSAFSPMTRSTYKVYFDAAAEAIGEGRFTKIAKIFGRPIGETAAGVGIIPAGGPVLRDVQKVVKDIANEGAPKASKDASQAFLSGIPYAEVLGEVTGNPGLTGVPMLTSFGEPTTPYSFFSMLSRPQESSPAVRSAAVLLNNLGLAKEGPKEFYVAGEVVELAHDGKRWQMNFDQRAQALESIGKRFAASLNANARKLENLKRQGKDDEVRKIVNDLAKQSRTAVLNQWRGRIPVLEGDEE